MQQMSWHELGAEMLSKKRDIGKKSILQVIQQSGLLGFAACTWQSSSNGYRNGK